MSVIAKISKEEAARVLGKPLSFIDRAIARGFLTTQRDKEGVPLIVRGYMYNAIVFYDGDLTFLAPYRGKWGRCIKRINRIRIFYVQQGRNHVFKCIKPDNSLHLCQSTKKQEAWERMQNHCLHEAQWNTREPKAGIGLTVKMYLSYKNIVDMLAYLPRSPEFIHLRRKLEQTREKSIKKSKNYVSKASPQTKRRRIRRKRMEKAAANNKEK